LHSFRRSAGLRQLSRRALTGKESGAWPIANRCLHNLNIADFVEAQVVFQMRKINWIRLEREDAALRSDATRQQQCVITNVGTYIECNHAGADQGRDEFDAWFFIPAEPAPVSMRAGDPP